MSHNPPPFSIRPIKPPGDRKPKTIAEFITRVNTTRPGGFRALKQTKKTQDVKADTDVRMDDAAGSEEEADTEPVKDPKTARDEIAKGIV
jgi:mediator of RNA polymerase II transcription subunit 17